MASANTITCSSAHAKAVELGKHVIEMTTAAGSGHPSTALALVHLVVELMYRHMRYDLADPWNLDNDRLVLSVGHAVPAVYAAYADLGGIVSDANGGGRPLTVGDLATLREQHSVLDGHPNPAEGFPFFDAATGSLGQGLSVAAGLAKAAKLNGSARRVYVLMGDGEAREGQVWEALDFIVDHGLTNVCLIISANGHGQAAPVSSQQSVAALSGKLQAFGWGSQVIDGHDPDAIQIALTAADSASTPFAIVAETVKGWGCDLMLGKNFHGKPVPQEQVPEAKAQLDETGLTLQAEAGDSARPQPPAGNTRPHDGAAITLPGFREAVIASGQAGVLETKSLATRAGYGIALLALGGVDERVVALDADVSNSTYSDRFAKAFPDRFVECKIAEQNMISVAAGMAAGGRIPFASSFAKFIARAVDQIDMAAISRANIKIVGSHAGVSLAADGPSQMAVSDVAYFRSLTRVDTGKGQPLGRMFQPSDAISAYRCVELMANLEGLCYMRTHRPGAAFLYDLDARFDLDGFKVLREGKDLALVSTGYMTHVVLEASAELRKGGIDYAIVDVFMLPLNRSRIMECVNAFGGRALAVEDNYIGGLGSELAEAAAESGRSCVRSLNANRVPKSAKSAGEVFEHVGVGKRHIIMAVEKLLSD